MKYLETAVHQSLVEVKHQALAAHMLWSNGGQERLGNAILYEKSEYDHIGPKNNTNGTDRDARATVLNKALLLILFVMDVVYVLLFVRKACPIRILRGVV